MKSVGSEAVRRVLERHQPMLGLHGHIHESRGAVRLGRALAINPGSEYGDGVLRGALLELDARKGIRSYSFLPGRKRRPPEPAGTLAGAGRPRRGALSGAGHPRLTAFRLSRTAAVSGSAGARNRSQAARVSCSSVTASVRRPRS